MKTLRELLLEQHRGVSPKLDRLRSEVLRNALGREASETDGSRGIAQWLLVRTARRVWQELIWPCRRAWAGMAAVWVAVLVFNLTVNKVSTRALANFAASKPVRLETFEEQRQLVAELLGPAAPAAPPPADKPRTKPGPRTDTPAEWRIS